MCGPAIGALSAVTGLIGSAVSAAGASQQAEAQAQQDEYNAKVAKINARTEMQKSIPEAEAKIQEYNRVQGTVIANAGKNNVDPFFGSAALIFGANEADKQQDMRRISENATSRKTAYENQATALEASAQNHRKAGKIAAASSFLSGLGQAAGALGKSGGVGSTLMVNS